MPRAAEACQLSSAPSPAAAQRQTFADGAFLLRTDVKSYYASIDHLRLPDQLAVHIYRPVRLQSPLMPQRHVQAYKLGRQSPAGCSPAAGCLQ